MINTFIPPGSLTLDEEVYRTVVQGKSDMNTRSLKIDYLLGDSKSEDEEAYEKVKNENTRGDFDKNMVEKGEDKDGSKS